MVAIEAEVVEGEVVASITRLKEKAVAEGLVAVVDVVVTVCPMASILKTKMKIEWAAATMTIVGVEVDEVAQEAKDNKRLREGSRPPMAREGNVTFLSKNDTKKQQMMLRRIN